jgi:hypothetical protein
MQLQSNLRFVSYCYDAHMLSFTKILQGTYRGHFTMTNKLETKHNLRGNTDSKNTLRKKLDPKETAQYIADMVLELRNMAKSADHKTLQGLLEVSFYEAFSAANRVDIPPEELDKLRELSRASVA